MYIPVLRNCIPHRYIAKMDEAGCDECAEDENSAVGIYDAQSDRWLIDAS
jgi:hypothetical protein